jgi:hypothetical protein
MHMYFYNPQYNVHNDDKSDVESMTTEFLEPKNTPFRQQGCEIKEKLRNFKFGQSLAITHKKEAKLTTG